MTAATVRFTCIRANIAIRTVELRAALDRRHHVGPSRSPLPRAGSMPRTSLAYEPLRVRRLGRAALRATLRLECRRDASPLRGLQLPGDGGQRLIACPLLDAALELLQRGQSRASWMPNDPYDLANAPARTASRRRPVGGGRALAVSAAAVTDHVCDSGHELTASQASLSGLEEAHSGWCKKSHGICLVPGVPRDMRAEGDGRRCCTPRATYAADPLRRRISVS